MMHINPDEFLKHINDGRNVAYFKGAPAFNLEDREEGEITIRVSGVGNNSYAEAAKDAVAVLQALHDTCLAVMFVDGDACLIKPVNSIENIYLYVDTEKRSVSFKDNAYSATFPFSGTKGFAKFITGLTGKCVEISYNKTLDETHVAEDYAIEVGKSYEGATIPADMCESEQTQLVPERKIERLSHGSDIPGRYAEKKKHFTKKPASGMVKEKDDLLIDGVLRYRTRKFKRTEDLVRFLNRREIAKEDIIDIQHKWFSHVLIYCYKKEVE